MNKTVKFKIIVAIVCISFIQGLQYSVSPILGQISGHYPDVDVSLVQMLITAPALLSILVSILSGFLVVKISVKKLLLIGAVISGVTGFLPFLADNFWLLFVSRTVYGIGLGIATTMNVAVVAEFFEGNERAQVMGIQAASVGAGVAVVSTLGGMLGRNTFTNSYFINVIGFIAFALIAVCLPDTGTVRETESEKIRLNRKVFMIDLFGVLEFIFLMSFTTNIAMHISGSLAGNTTVSGNLTGIFSGAQIVIGLLLGIIAKRAGRMTLPLAMFSFAAGAVILVAFPSSFPMLAAGAVLCGFSQGMFVPTALTELSNSVPQVATAMASASFTCAMNLGQLISPYALNTASGVLLGETTTGNVYIISVIGMVISAALAGVWKMRSSSRTAS